MYHYRLYQIVQDDMLCASLERQMDQHAFFYISESAQQILNPRRAQNLRRRIMGEDFTGISEYSGKMNVPLRLYQIMQEDMLCAPHVRKMHKR